MAELTVQAALRHAYVRRYGKAPDEAFFDNAGSAREARIRLNSGDPLAWATNGAASPGSAQAGPATLIARFAQGEIARLVSRQPALDDQAVRKRLEACGACPHYQPAPNTRLYALGRKILRADEHICALCGCFVSEKAARAAEHCPDAMPGTPRVSRWGDPVAKEGT